MKIKYYMPFALMALLMLVLQVIALALTEPMKEQGFQAFENPESSWNSIIYIGIILVFTLFILMVIKLNKKWVIQFIILLTVISTLWYVFFAAFAFMPVETNLLLTAVLSIALTALLYKFPEWYVIDITGILIGAGASAIFGISLAITPTLVLLIGLAIYDALAVYKTKHMITLAEGVMDLKMPVLLVIPKHLKYSFLKEDFKKEEREAFFMGLGDAVMPTILIVSAKRFITDANLVSLPIIGDINAPVVGAIIGTFVGFAALMVLVAKGKPQAGLPFLNSGVIIGFFAGFFASGASLPGL